jgi:hypothetical protein
MKTSELLDHITGAMLDDRTEMISGENDELFKTPTVLRYLNEAQRKLCRDAWVLEDLTTPAVCEIALQPNVINYPLHKSILHVKAARLSDTEIDLLRVGYNDNRLRSDAGPENYDHWDINLVTTEDPGRPQRYSVDMGTRILRLRRAPDADSALLKLRLSVVRMPLKELSDSQPDEEPEVPEEHHLELCSFAAGSCLANTADLDAEQRSLGRSWVQAFNERCEIAKRDRERRQQSVPQFRFGAWVRGC